MKRAFNILYFLSAAAVFVWLLRDQPHVRIVPVSCLLLLAMYATTLLLALVKPAGFRLERQLIPSATGRCLRSIALLLPVPAMLYCFAYHEAVSLAGTTSLINFIYEPIARVEKACFGKHRSSAFIARVYRPISDGVWKSEYIGNTVGAESFARTAAALEEIYF